MISVLNKSWKPKPYDFDVKNYLIKNMNLSYILAHLLSTTSISLDDISDFLEPKIKNFIPDPYHLLDMEKGVNRVLKVFFSNEKICIFGDYDVDGACSSALLFRFFKDLGIQSEIYIPDRIEEGYGPNISAFEKIHQSGCSLVITVDCGISSHIAVKYANNVGLDVIVIDHHISTNILPDALAVINPNRLDQKSKYKNLCGAGVTLLFCVAIMQQIKNSEFSKNIKVLPNLMSYIDLVALATVCDVVPLTGFNRAIVHQGLKLINQRNNAGMSAIFDLTNIQEPITQYHLGFIVGPRINAAGRVGNSSLGSRILSSDNVSEVKIIANKLEANNSDRKKLQEEILLQAISAANTFLHNNTSKKEGNDANVQKIVANKNIIVLYNANWHPGVIGIIASKIVDRFELPAIIITNSNGIGKASCRSIPGVNIGAKVVNAQLKGLIVNGGGHSMAAGFSIEIDKINTFIAYINEAVEQETETAKSLLQYRYFDACIPAGAVTLNTVNDINKLAPFGNGNPIKLVRIKSLKIAYSKIVGQGHISCTFCTKSNKKIQCISFNSVNTPIGNTLLSYYTGFVSVIGELQINYFNNTCSVQLVLRDIILGD